MEEMLQRIEVVAMKLTKLDCSTWMLWREEQEKEWMDRFKMHGWMD